MRLCVGGGEGAGGERGAEEWEPLTAVYEMGHSHL